jgi:uncharacterized protein
VHRCCKFAKAGNVLKAILLIFLVALAYWLFAGGRRAADPRRQSQPHQPERMVKCAYCQLRVPEGESQLAAGKYYCCDEHRRLGTS